MMKFFASDDFSLPLPEGHRFPAQKYKLLREYLLAHHILSPEQLGASPPADDAVILSTHDPAYLA
ncbi:MAG: histone deacetylase, partial [Pseudomonadota bacterium]